MKGLLKFEFKRMVCDKKHIYFFAIFLAVSFYFVNSGIKDYLRFQRDKVVFSQSEKSRTPYYTNYNQYSGYGFRVLLEPSPLVVFFGNSSVFFDLEANVDNTQIIKLYNLLKGKNLFYNTVYFKDFAGFIYFVGSLIMIYMGISSFRSIESIRYTCNFISARKLFFASSAVRLLYLNIVFSFLIAVAFLYTRFYNLAFSDTEVLYYFLYGLFTLVLLNFFYFIGLLLAIVLKFNKISFVWMFVVWLFFTFLLPEINRLYLSEYTETLPPNETVNIQKLKLLMDFEKKAKKKYTTVTNESTEVRRKFINESIKDYLDNYNRLNQLREDILYKQVNQAVLFYERQTHFFPTLFYYFLSSEISSKGYQGYLAFQQYIFVLQEKFLRYYLEKHFALRETKVQSFVKHNENLFKAPVFLPRSYWKSLVFSSIYCFVILFFSYVIFRRLVYSDD